MKKVLIDIKNMSDSREVYMTKANPWIAAFIYSMIGMIGILIAFLCTVKIDIYTTAKGVIRPNDDVGEVVPLVGGKVTAVCFYDGQYVNEGDVLFTIDTSETELKMAELKDNEQKYLFEQQMLQKYLEAIDSGKNIFNSDVNGDEYKYYLSYLDYSLNLENNKMKYMYDTETNDVNLQNYSNRLSQINYEIDGLDAYKNSIEKGQNLCGDYLYYNNMYMEYLANVTALTNDYDTEISSINNDTTVASENIYIDYYRIQIAGYDSLILSISDGVSMFSEEDDSSYKLMYENYLREIEQYEQLYQDDRTSLDKAITTYKNNILASYISSRDELKAKADSLELQMASIKDTASKSRECTSSYLSKIDLYYWETICNIETQIEALKNERDSVETNIRLYSLAGEKYSSLVGEDGIPIEVSIYKVETCLDILSEIEICNENLDSIKAEIAIVQEQIDKGNITASKSGIVNMVNLPIVGNVIDAGDMAATIIPVNECGYRVLMYVNNSEIAKINTDQTIKYNINALPYNRYGTVDGKIVNVSVDTIGYNGELTGYYLVEGSISDENLYDYEGNEGEIEVGMEVTARIVTERKTIARYLFEKIDIF